ncbi:unnamed protein product, partial [Brachionus calyciflorus]
MDSERLDFAIEFDNESIIEQLNNGEQIRLSFLSYNSPKFFLRDDDLNQRNISFCKREKHLSENILSVSSTFNNFTQKDGLINIFYGKQKTQFAYFNTSIQQLNKDNTNPFKRKEDWSFKNSLCKQILPSNDVKTNESENFILIQYRKMSKDYLRIFTFWCFSLLIMNLLFIPFSLFKNDKIYDKKQNLQKNGTCSIIGIFIHYFLLNSFCLSFCQTLIQYSFSKYPFKIYKNLFTKSIVFSFLTPLIPVITIISVENDAYLNPNGYCWLNGKNAVYSAFIPIFIILSSNIGIFIVFFKRQRNMIKRTYKLKKRENSKIDKKRFILVVSVFVNSELTWFFGFLLTFTRFDSNTRFVIAVIFCILNSTQGLHVLFVYIFLSNER